MKSKLLVICSSVALLHLLVGGMLFFSGCASVEDDPLPPGAYIPAAKNTPQVNTTEEIPEPVTPVTVIEPIEAPLPPARTPAKKTTPKYSGETQTHSVKKGESFWSISQIYAVTVDELMAANSGVNPTRLRVGQKITIPAQGKAVKAVVRSKKTTTKATKTASVKAKKTTAKLPDNDGKYTVRKGDSFARIAAKFQIKTADLAAANSLSLEKPLQIGQKLVIPKAGQKIAARSANTASSKVKGTSAPKTAAASDVALPAVPVSADPNAVPAVPALGEEVAAPDLGAAPAVPLASAAAVDAVAKDTAAVPAAPVAPGSAAASYTAEINEDTTLDALAKKYGFGVADLKKLNPEVSADGKVRAGSVIKLP